jgi:hypothetical protein
MKIIAIADAWWNDRRFRAGRVYDVDEALIPRTPLEGKDAEGHFCYEYPRWMKPATDVHLRLYEKQQREAENKAAAAALAASGTAGAVGKKQSFLDAMASGSARDMQAERAALASSGSAGYQQKKVAFETARDTGRGPRTQVKRGT